MATETPPTPADQPQGNTKIDISIATDGSTVSGSTISVGAVIGRDKIIQGDEVHGDKVEGDKYNVETQIIGYTAEQVAVIIAEIRREDQPKRWNGRIPYVGLDSFREDQANLFFGRDKLITHLLTRVKESKFLCITGPSGSGKSSLVQAGLIPALHAGKIPGSEQWLFETATPGNQPLENLALAMGRMAKSPSGVAYLRSQGATDPAALHAQIETLLGHHPNQRALIVVDQFEELFTQTKDEAVRLAFLALLTNAAQQADARVIVLLVMRSDFVSQCANYPELRKLISGNLELVGAMEPHELAQAIVMPALEVGVEVKPDLVAQVITDMRGEPGALPLMQFALKDLFDTQTKQQDNHIVLTLQEYLTRGGIQQALERHANAQFAKFSLEEQGIARKIFMGLIEIGQGTVDTRRIATFAELLPIGADTLQTEKVIKALADARLITTDTLQPNAEINLSLETRNVTIAHEKLIEVWPWLAQLVRENRALIELQNQISTDAVKWDKNDRDSSYLYSGARLQSVQEQLTTNHLALSPLAQQLIAASGQAETERLQQIENIRQRELDNQRQRAELFRNWSVVAIILLLLAILAAGVSFYLNGRLNSTNIQLQQTATESQHQAAIALSRQLAAQSTSELSKNNYELAILLAIESGKVTATLESFASIRAALAAPWRSKGVFYEHEHTAVIYQAKWSHDESKILTRSDEGTARNGTRIRIWDAVTGKELVKFVGHTYFVYSAEWGKDDSKILTSSADGTARTWDAVTGKELVKFVGHTASVSSAEWSKDDSKILTSSDDETARIWDAGTGKELVKFVGHTSLVYSAEWSQDESKILTASGDNTARIWDAVTGKELVKFVGHTEYLFQATWSHNERKILTSSYDRTTRIWDASTSQELVKLEGYTDYVSSATWSQDDSKILTSSTDGTARIWDAGTGQELVKFVGHMAFVSSAEWSKDESKILTSNADNTARIWDASTGKELVKFAGHTSQVLQAQWSQNDNKILTSSADNTARIWDSSTVQELVKLAGHTSQVLQAQWSQNDNKILTSSYDDTARIWDTVTGKQLVKFIGHTDYISSAKWSKDESKILTRSADETTRIWDAATGKQLLKLEKIASTEWSKDESKILTSSADNTVRIWDVPTGKQLVMLEGHTDYVSSATWSKDESKILTSSADNTVRIWDVATGKQLVILEGHTDYVSSATWNKDENKILTSSGDGTVRIWDAVTGKELVKFIGHTASVSSAEWSKDESKILTLSGFPNSVACIWDAVTSEQLVKLEGIYSVVWSHDDSKILIASSDNTASIWDVATGRELVKFIGHTASVSSAEWSKDESKVLTLSGFPNSVARIWDATTGKELVKLEGVSSVKWSHDESKILTSSADGTLRIWYAHMADLLVAACTWTPRNFTQSEWNAYREGDYYPTCLNAPIPPDAIDAIKAKASDQIRSGQAVSGTQRLDQLNGWLKETGQFKSFGVDVQAFVVEVAATATVEATSK